MRDFSTDKYKALLQALCSAGYTFAPLCEFAKAQSRTICLRHDVDARPGNSLEIARVESAQNIRSTYYFRAVPQSWDERVIRQIAALGHEIGYHYESLTTCNGDLDAAYDDFCGNLAKLREIVPVQTICMHGSPRSRFDSKDLWTRFDYKSLGLIAEPYLDTDWEHTFYLTDTGRCWDGYNVSLRDKIEHWQDVWTARGLVFHSTDDLIRGAVNLPDRVMITTHPQRWSDGIVEWSKELVSQKLKNIIKSRLVNRR